MLMDYPLNVKKNIPVIMTLDILALFKSLIIFSETFLILFSNIINPKKIKSFSISSLSISLIFSSLISSFLYPNPITRNPSLV
jgi:hypothetical protein